MQPGTSAALKQMEHRGLVKPTTDPKDRRSVRVFLTPKSRTLLDKLIPIAAKVRDQATSDFSEREDAFDKLNKDGFAGRLMFLDKQRERVEKEQDLKSQEYAIAA